MSGRTAKRARQLKRARSESEMNGDKVLAATAAVLAEDLAEFPPARSVQVPVGWLRAVMEQCRAIVLLSRAGHAEVAAPNRRSASEILVRLQWLATMKKDDRAAAVDSLIEEEKRLAKNQQLHVLEMGLTEAPPIGDIDAVVTNSGDDSEIRKQAKVFTEAAKAAKGAGLYLWWQRDTQMTHATMQLAAALAPVSEERLAKGAYAQADPDLKLVLNIAVFSVMYASMLLNEAGVSNEHAFRHFHAFFSGIRRAI